MKAQDFKNDIHDYLDELYGILSTETGDWVIKGFIDVFCNIYTVSVDTKVVSKIIELMLYPLISKFAVEKNYKMVPSSYQNHYPDVSFIANDGTKFALDFKSTYRKSTTTVNGFTLGAFTGYFRNRDSKKNITFPYSEYKAHFVLGIIYSRNEIKPDEGEIHKLDNLHNITSVVKDFSLLLQEKWQIACEKPGSGNTKNIGSIKDINKLINGEGHFTKYNKKVFDDYWMNYLTNDMAKAIDSNIPYKNLEEYWRWKSR